MYKKMQFTCIEDRSFTIFIDSIFYNNAKRVFMRIENKSKKVFFLLALIFITMIAAVIVSATNAHAYLTTTGSKNPEIYGIQNIASTNTKSKNIINNLEKNTPKDTIIVKDSVSVKNASISTKTTGTTESVIDSDIVRIELDMQNQEYDYPGIDLREKLEQNPKWKQVENLYLASVNVEAKSITSDRIYISIGQQRSYSSQYPKASDQQYADQMNFFVTNIFPNPSISNEGNWLLHLKKKILIKKITLCFSKEGPLTVEDFFQNLIHLGTKDITYSSSNTIQDVMFRPNASRKVKMIRVKATYGDFIVSSVQVRFTDGSINLLYNTDGKYRDGDIKYTLIENQQQIKDITLRVTPRTEGQSEAIRVSVYVIYSK